MMFKSIFNTRKRRDYLTLKRSALAMNRYTYKRRTAIASGRERAARFYGERAEEHLKVLEGYANRGIYNQDVVDVIKDSNRIERENLTKMLSLISYRFSQLSHRLRRASA